MGRKLLAKVAKLLDPRKKIIMMGFQQLGIEKELDDVPIKAVNALIRATEPCLKRTADRSSGPNPVIIFGVRRRSHTSFLEKYMSAPASPCPNMSWVWVERGREHDYCCRHPQNTSLVLFIPHNNQTPFHRTRLLLTLRSWLAIVVSMRLISAFIRLEIYCMPELLRDS